MAREVVLHRLRDARGTRVLTATKRADGSVQIGGQDLGTAVGEIFGVDVREYEWDWTLEAADVGRAVEVLGGPVGGDVIDALARWTNANSGRDPGQFLKESGLRLGFWSRMGD